MAIAFVGGLITALAVIGLAGVRSLTPARLVLAGSALAKRLSSLQALLLLLFPRQTPGIVEWNAGSLAQNGSDATALAAQIIIGIAALLALTRRLDLLQLGDDTAAAFGVSVGSTRLMTLLLSIILIAAAVVVSGPIGFVGMCAPASVRLLAR